MEVAAGEVGTRLDDSAVPLQVQLDEDVAFSAGHSRAIAIRADGIVWAWESNRSGQLGDGGSGHRANPGNPIQIRRRSYDLAAGDSHGLAIGLTDLVWSWGQSTAGQLGRCSPGGCLHGEVPGTVPSFSYAAMVSAGAQHSVALRYDGTVWTWGINSSGQLGDGTAVARWSPVRTLGVLPDIVSVAAGRNHSLAVDIDGNVYAWGANNRGQLGDGTTVLRRIPIPVPGLSNIAAVAAGLEHSLALRRDGVVFGWGRNNRGQLGDTTSYDRPAPVQVSVPCIVTAIASNDSHSLAICQGGEVYAWGSNAQGQLGRGFVSNYDNVPQRVSNLVNMPAVAISAGFDHSMAVLYTGEVVSWGGNATGQIGDASFTIRTLPTAPYFLPPNGVGIAAGRGFSFAAVYGGATYSWGDNQFGNLGNHTNISINYPQTTHLP